MTGLRTVDSVLVQLDKEGYSVLLHYAEGGQDLWASNRPYSDAIKLGRWMARDRNVRLVLDETSTRARAALNG